MFWSDSMMLAPDPIAKPGQTIFAPGTTSWIVPSGMTKISAVAVGAGSSGNGGGGGELRWSNDIAVSSGETLEISVGTSGSGVTSPGPSTIKRGSTVLLQANGGSSGTTTSGGSGGIGDGGGDGGNAAGSGRSSGGAGGYTAPGGNGSGSAAGKGGGGVGLLGGTVGGVGGNGTSGAGAGGSGGAAGSGTSGGNYGGGAFSPGIPGIGAIRIMWGDSRSYPANAANV